MKRLRPPVDDRGVLRLAPLPILAVLALATPAAAHEAHEGDAVPLVAQGGPVELHGDVIPPGMDDRLEAASARAALRQVDALDVDAPTLADSWCGTQTTVDDVANASTSPGAAIKLVYAHPSDQPDRFATFAEWMQDDAREIAASFATAADGTKTVRFDTGTSCGARYVDVISIALPRTRATYLALTLDDRFDALRTDLRARLTSVAGKRDFLVYADALPAGGVSGVATLFNDDRKLATNASNGGGQFAFVFSFGSSRRTTAQHELGHNLGAVQDSAPHSTLAGHCYERYDVMCYADGGPKGQTSDLVTTCATASPPAWDCRADDYFHPNPAPGSYLATHWNLYDSVYLCPPADCIVVDDDDDEAAVTPNPTPTPPSGGSGGGGGGGGGGSAPVTPTPTTPTTPAPAPPAVTPTPPPPAPAQVIVDAPLPTPSPRAVLTAAASTALDALRDGGPARVTLTAPRAGTLVARITLRGRTVARASTAVDAGERATLRLRPPRVAHPERLRLTLRLT